MGARKQEARKMLEKEESAMPAKPAGKAKLTRAEIEANQERERAEAERGRVREGRVVPNCGKMLYSME